MAQPQRKRSRSASAGAAVSYKTAQKKLFEALQKDETSSPAFLILADDGYVRELLFKKICHAFLQGERTSLNCNRVDAVDFSTPSAITGLLSELQAKGMFCERKVVEIRGISANKSPRFHKALQKYLEHPTPECCFILSDKKLVLAADLKKGYSENSGLLPLEVAKLTMAEVSEHIDERMKEEAVILPAQGKNEIIERVGTDLSAVDNFLDSLILFKGEGEVSSHEIHELIFDLREETVFSLVDAVAKGDFDSAYRQVVTLMDYGTDATGIIALLFFKFRCILLTKYAKEVKKMHDAKSIGDETGLKYYPVKNSLPLISAFSFDALKTVYLLLHDCDRKIKTTSLNPAVLIESLIVALCQIRQRA